VAECRDDGGAGGGVRPGDWVIFDGGEHEVVALAGTSLRLRSSGGTEQVVLGSYAGPDLRAHPLKVGCGFLSVLQVALLPVGLAELQQVDH
jgi:hypothetical protein